MSENLDMNPFLQILQKGYVSNLDSGSFSWKDQLCGLLANNRQWAFAASQVIVWKLGVGWWYTNDKTSSSLTPSPITLIYIHINNVISFLVPSFPFIVSLNDVLLTLSSVFPSRPFLINTHTLLHTLTYNNSPPIALHPTPGGVNLQLQTTSHTTLRVLFFFKE